MTADEYIEMYPQKFKDDLDKWLFKEFNLTGGACSSIRSMEYSVAREVAEKAIQYAKDKITEDAVEASIGHHYSRSKDNSVGRTIFCNNSLNHYETGEKVKLIILKYD